MGILKMWFPLPEKSSQTSIVKIILPKIFIWLIIKLWKLVKWISEHKKYQAVPYYYSLIVFLLWHVPRYHIHLPLLVWNDLKPNNTVQQQYIFVRVKKLYSRPLYRISFHFIYYHVYHQYPSINTFHTAFIKATCPPGCLDFILPKCLQNEKKIMKKKLWEMKRNWV